MTDLIIETNQLTKTFKGQQALSGLDLRVPAGSIFGFLGRNGPGKTTAIKTLMGLLHIESGEARSSASPRPTPTAPPSCRGRVPCPR